MITMKVFAPWQRVSMSEELELVIVHAWSCFVCMLMQAHMYVGAPYLVIHFICRLRSSNPPGSCPIIHRLTHTWDISSKDPSFWPHLKTFFSQSFVFPSFLPFPLAPPNLPPYDLEWPPNPMITSLSATTVQVSWS